MPQVAFFEKKFVPLSEAKVGVMTHALNYGTACFEGIRGNWNAKEGQIYLFRLKEHYERLHKSCRILKISLAFDVEKLCQITVDLVRKNGYREDIYVRPLAYKSSQMVGVRLHNLEDDFFIFVTPFGPYLDAEKGAKCGVSSWRRVDDTSIPPRGKVTGIYVNSALAKTEAHENGFDEAIMLSHDGHVSEGSGENIFIVEGGGVVTMSTKAFGHMAGAIGGMLIIVDYFLTAALSSTSGFQLSMSFFLAKTVYWNAQWFLSLPIGPSRSLLRMQGGTIYYTLDGADPRVPGTTTSAELKLVAGAAQ